MVPQFHQGGSSGVPAVPATILMSGLTSSHKLHNIRLRVIKQTKLRQIYVTSIFGAGLNFCQTSC